MKPILFKVTKKEDAAFLMQNNEGKPQYGQLHFHPEYQISLVQEGAGMLQLGEKHLPFAEGDLFVIGAGLPHVFRAFDRKQNPLLITSLFFTEDSFGKGFFRLPELYRAQQFLQESKKGIQIHDSYQGNLARYFLNLDKAPGLNRIVQFLRFLDHLALNPALGSTIGAYTGASEKAYIKSSYQRLQRVFQYIADNFDRTISLEDAARLTHLNKYTFARYFKKITHKSFIDYLNEFRISVACRLLRRRHYSITQISLQCGYNNLSHFYRQFKKYMRCTPSEYRRQLAE